MDAKYQNMDAMIRNITAKPLPIVFHASTAMTMHDNPATINIPISMPNPANA